MAGQVHVRHAGMLGTLYGANHVAVDFDGHGPAQQLHANHHPESVLFAEQDAFESGELAALNARLLPHAQVRPGLRGQSRRLNGPDPRDLVVRHGRGDIG